MKASVIVLSIIVLILASQCLAGSGRGYVGDNQTLRVNYNVKFAIHLAPHGTYTCKKQPTISVQGDIVNNLDAFGAGVDAFMVVFDYDSLKVVEWGLTWPAEWGTASTSVCVANAISVGGILNPGDGIAITWSGDPACRIPNGLPGGNTAPFFIPAYSWLSPTGIGEIVIKEDPPTGVYGVSSCGDETSAMYTYPNYVYDAGILMSGGGIYDGPPRATEPTTWGAIKSVFK